MCLDSCERYVPIYCSTFTPVNVARACGANQNLACPTTASAFYTDFPPADANDNNDNTMMHGAGGGGFPHWVRIDLGITRHITHTQLMNRDTQTQRSSGGLVKVGMSATHATNSICVTLSTARTQNRDCVLSGQYVHLVFFQDTVNFMELRVFISQTNVVGYEDGCTSCVADTPKNIVGTQGASKKSQPPFGE